MSRSRRDAAPSLHPQGPLAAARAGAMLERLDPALKAEAGTLAAQVRALAGRPRAYGQGSDQLAAGLDKLAAAHAALASAMARAAPPLTDPGVPAVTMMARDSASLTALAAALAETPGAPPPPADAGRGASAGRSPAPSFPASTRPTPPASAGPGLVLGAPPQSLVSAPADAVVRYAGPFLEYGFVVVLEPAPETMLVLAGLERLQVATGATVKRGDFLGLLGGRPLDVEEYVMLPDADTGSGGSETLYIEVRQGRGPVDPEPLFAGENG